MLGAFSWAENAALGRPTGPCLGPVCAYGIFLATPAAVDGRDPGGSSSGLVNHDWIRSTRPGRTAPSTTKWRRAHGTGAEPYSDMTPATHPWRAPRRGVRCSICHWHRYGPAPSHSRCRRRPSQFGRNDWDFYLQIEPQSARPKGRPHSSWVRGAAAAAMGASRRAKPR